MDSIKLLVGEFWEINLSHVPKLPHNDPRLVAFFNGVRQRIR